MNNPVIMAALKWNQALMRELGTSSLPAFIVGNQPYRATIDQKALSAAVGWVRKKPSMQ